ncbi:hypothetical protein [Pseudomonas sp. CCOS 191]|uniref:hypothetical protein n=1 Tax=Pseudomonas sp. CCOS 191 TaxID=1649877 RepID=UPI0018E68209|nr:hypothetical protein [Pseudomonas sp. CCOS 191]MBI6955950.1 hypothetical protein [Pseudomonas sp. CCOS 191]
MNFEIPAPLLSWMEKEATDNDRRLYGWDMIIGLPLELLNAALQHDSLQRIAGDLGVEGLGGSIPINESTQEYELQGYRLSNLALQVAATNYGTPRVKVAALMEGGAQIYTRGQHEVLMLSEHLPFSGIDAGLELPFSYSAGKLGASLRDGSAHKLAVGDGAVGQENAAELFKQMLLDLEAPRAQLQIAQVQVNDDNPLRRVKEMHLRTQVDGSTQVADGETPTSSVLLFVNFEHGGPVDYPIQGDTFPYLLGADGEGGQGCTALVSRHLLHRVAFGQSLMACLQGGRYDYGDSSEQPLPRITVDEGVLPLPNGLYNSTLLSISYDEFTLDASSGTLLNVEFKPDGANQEWQPRCRLDFRYRIVGSETWTPHSVLIQPQLNYSLHLSEADTSGDLLKGLWREVATRRAQIEGLPDELSEALQDEMASALEQIVRAAYLKAVNARPSIRVTEQLLPFLRLFDTQDLRWQVGATPNNQVVVGTFDKAEGQFRIEQQEAQLVEGQPFEFTVRPPRPGLKWRVEALPGSPSTEGMDEETGVYLPPATGGNWRVRVVAEDPATGLNSSTLVSVSSVGVMMDPLFKYLIRGHGGEREQVRFAAASMEEGAVKYEWRVEGDEGVKGSFEAQTDSSVAIYTPGPRQEGRTYVIDRVVMTNTATQATRRGVVLSEHAAPQLTIWRAPEETEKGLKLEAWYGEGEEPLEGIDWTVVGPGEVKDDYYSVDPSAPDAFVLIIGTLNVKEELFEGHLVLPLPLDRFPRLSAAQATRKRRRQGAGTRLSMHQGDESSLELLPKGTLSVGPGHRVKFEFPGFEENQKKWRVERVKGDPNFKGEIDSYGQYTAGNTDTGSDLIIAEAWSFGLIKLATATATIENTSDMPVWTGLKKFDLQAPRFGATPSRIYGNGHMQLEVSLQMETSGEPILTREIDSVRLYSVATDLQLPELKLESPRVLPKTGPLWAFSRDRNAYDLASPNNSFDVQEAPGILDQRTHYLFSRADENETVEYYAGLQDRHGAWHYSDTGESGVIGTPTITVTVSKHEVNVSEFVFRRYPVWPDGRGSGADDFDLILNTLDYWILEPTTNRRFFQVKVMSGGDDKRERGSMVMWEDEHDQVDMVSYTGWAFWSAKGGEARPEVMTFDVDALTRLLPKPDDNPLDPGADVPIPDYMGKAIDANKFVTHGLLIGNFRVDNYFYSKADKTDVGLYKSSLLFKLQDSQGNSIDLWVSYDVEDALRYRDYIVSLRAKPGDEW